MIRYVYKLFVRVTESLGDGREPSEGGSEILPRLTHYGAQVIPRANPRCTQTNRSITP